ncbi:MAG: GGDEF domain-containing protein [Gammaproteobacteria bacterium]
MQLDLDDLWLEKMDSWGWNSLTVTQKRRLYRVILVAAIGVSYLIDFILLSLFAAVGTIQTTVLWFYPTAGLVHVLLFSTMHWTGFSERFSNPHMTLWGMCYAVLVESISIILAPQLSAFFLGIMFVIFAFGTLRISLKEMLAVWLFACIASGLTLGLFVHDSLGIVTPSRWESVMVAIAFATVLLRAIALGYYSSVLRMNVFKRNLALQRAATHDALTGLLNRNAVLPALRNYIDLCRRKDMKTAVAMLDIDRFKSVNDTLGHMAGDAVLARLARYIKGRLRESDMVGRYGGEEFIILLPTVDAAEAIVAMNRLRAGIAALSWPQTQDELQVTVSCGVTEILPADELDMVIARADKALYEAKRNGRNCVRPSSSLAEGVA